MELAEAIVKHPLAAQGDGEPDLAASFRPRHRGYAEQLRSDGRAPTHPELLDYLAARFIESGWSMKAMHREIMLSATYQLAYQRVGCEFRGRSRQPAALASEFPASRSGSAAGFAAVRDRHFWTSGSGGPPQDLARANNKKRTIYGRAARSPYSLLTLFDYPDPNITSEQREVTNVPLQGSVLHEQRSGPAAGRGSARAAGTGRLERAGFDRQNPARLPASVPAGAESRTKSSAGLAFLTKAEALFQTRGGRACKPRRRRQPARSRISATAAGRQWCAPADGDPEARRRPALSQPAG